MMWLGPTAPCVLGLNVVVSSRTAGKLAEGEGEGTTAAALKARAVAEGSATPGGLLLVPETM